MKTYTLSDLWEKLSVYLYKINSFRHLHHVAQNLKNLLKLTINVTDKIYGNPKPAPLWWLKR